MSKVHSHYENLKVARDASAEQVRQAYRGLTRQHHPDRNPGNADAERIMSVINVAYDVISDPARRAEHDRWIAQAEQAEAQAELQARRASRVRPTPHVPHAPYQGAPSGSDEAARQRARALRLEQTVRRWVRHLRRLWPAYGAAACGLVYLAATTGPQAFPRVLGFTAVAPPVAPVEAAPRYVRPPQAPNGRPWPTQSGYVEGYDQLNNGGESEVVIDNSHNDTDMFAKLVSLDGPTAFPVRTLMVAARGRYTVTGLSIGTYDLRYRDLGSGGLLRSPAFIVEEVHTPRGTERSVVTLRLHRAGEGHMQAYQLGDAEFL